MGLKQGRIKTSSFKYYLGNQETVTFRSSWEYKAFMKLEQLGAVGKIIGWSSEDVVIPYMSDVDLKMHKYYMDIRVEMHDKVVLIEIKPYKDTYIPAKPKMFKTDAQKRNYEAQVLTSIKNQNKWKYTMQFCALQSERCGKPWTFQIWTEKIKSKTLPRSTFIREVFES